MFGHATYLTFEIAWALPVVLIQSGLGYRLGVYRGRLRVIVLAVLIATVYFSGADMVAIHNHIWTIHVAKISGSRIFILPIEELIFFFLTSCMVVLGYFLVTRGHAARANRL